jgi:hypothetical protein
VQCGLGRRVGAFLDGIAGFGEDVLQQLDRFPGIGCAINNLSSLFDQAQIAPDFLCGAKGAVGGFRISRGGSHTEDVAVV